MITHSRTKALDFYSLSQTKLLKIPFTALNTTISYICKYATFLGVWTEDRNTKPPCQGSKIVCMHDVLYFYSPRRPYHKEKSVNPIEIA